MSDSRNNRNLRMTPEEYAKKLWNWTPFNSCFMRGIKLTDIDGMVEANNHFLVIEGKTSTAGEVKLGQYNALFRMSFRDGFTVIYFEGDTETENSPQKIYCWRILRKGISMDYHFGEEKIDHIEELKSIIKEWFQLADSDKTPCPIWQRHK